MKKFVLVTLVVIILSNMIAGTNAVYQKSQQLQAGDLISKEPVIETSSRNIAVINRFTMQGSTIDGNVQVQNGDVDVRFWGNPNLITGTFTTNSYVTVTTNGKVEEVIPKGITYDKVEISTKGYDNSQFPVDLPNRGSISVDTPMTIDQNGYYDYLGVNQQLTIDTSKGDVYLELGSLNMNTDIVIQGKGKVTIRVLYQFNVNSGKMNPTKGYSALDLIVTIPWLSINNNMSICASLYVPEGNLYFGHGELNGRIIAPAVNVKLEHATIEADIVCNQLEMYSSTIKQLK